jgi:hypothetical protein
MKKKLNFIDWLRSKKNLVDKKDQSLISKHVEKVKSYADPIKLATADATDLNIARIFSSIEKLPPSEKEEKQKQIFKMQTDLAQQQQNNK